jgi:DNA-binding CsgD family transcriptional regulator
LVPSAYGTYSAVNRQTNGGWYATSPAGLDLGLSQDDMKFIAGVHPLIMHYRNTRDGAARKISDFMPQPCYHESALYREFFGRLDVESMIASYLPEHPPDTVAIALVRDLGDFTERERLVLNLLRPHLFQAYHNAETMTRLRETARLNEQVLEATHQGAIALNARGSVLFCSANARNWMTAYFLRPALASIRRLPEELQRWVRHQQLPNTKSGRIPPSRRPLVVEREGRQLAVRLVPGSVPGQQTLVLEERQTTQSPAPLRKLGLTDREAEVLLWVAQGKTSPEIGIILSCRTATVNKHMEHILGKLGVETRTAAAACAWQVMNSDGSERGC